MKCTIRADDDDIGVISTGEGDDERKYYIIVEDGEVYLGGKVSEADVAIPIEIFALMVEQYQRKWANELPPR